MIVVKYACGDITRVRGEHAAIVNAANVAMLGGGGVDGAIHLAAGRELKAWIRDNIPADKHGIRCPTGEARITPAFGIQVKNIIHTVGPIFSSARARNPHYPGEHVEQITLKGQDPKDLLAKSIRACFHLAEAHNINALVMPAISCGVFGCEIPMFAEILYEAVVAKEWSFRLGVVLFHKSEYDAFAAAWEDLTSIPW